MEFKIHHDVTELIKVLGVPEKAGESVTTNNYVEYLSRNQTPYISRSVSQSALRKLAENAPDSKFLLDKYEDLKARNFRELDSLVQLLGEISVDDKVKTTLRKHFSSSQKVKDKTCNGEEDDLEKSRNQLHERIFAHVVEAKSKQRSVPQGFAKFPKWVRERPNLTWDFNCQPRDDNVKVGPIGVLPHNTQENLLINDILYCLSGIDGDYVTAQPVKDLCSLRNFNFDESADPSLLEMTKRIMPICSYYSSVISFVEEKMHFEYGLVNHAVCAAMRDMLKDYFILIAQLENQHLLNKLSLQKIWFYLQPTMLKLKALSSAAIALNKGDCFGGTILSVLHKRATNLIGDKVGQEICLHLVQCASVPYFEILDKWIYKGMISDPYSEFLVEDNEICKIEDVPVEYSNNYWEKRYTVRRENIPVFLEKVTDMILRTGKYLNVIRQCGHNIECPYSTPLTYVTGEQSYFEKIQNAYHFASKKLLDLLMEENDLRGRLRSVKHYFLLDEGDFIVQFMDMAEEELCKDIDNIMPTRLETLLELALRTSVVNCDKYKDDVKVALVTESLQSQMSAILNIINVAHTEPTEVDKQRNPETPITGMEAFTFDYEVKWPLSLIINQRAIACYQFLFRHLLHCKHVEALLGRVWTLNKIAKTYPLAVSSSYSSAFALCQRMLNFIQNLDYYFTLEVIEPHWQFFLEKIMQVTNVDEVLQCHENFLNTCILDCMLAYPMLLEILGKLISLCISFSNFMQETHRNAVEAEFSSMGNSLLIPVYENMSMGPAGDTESITFQLTFKQQVLQYETDFDSLFVSFLQMITELSTKVLNMHRSSKMLNMLYRLDFSGFYTNKHAGEKAVGAKS